MVHSHYLFKIQNLYDIYFIIKYAIHLTCLYEDLYYKDCK